MLHTRMPVLHLGKPRRMPKDHRKSRSPTRKTMPQRKDLHQRQRSPSHLPQRRRQAARQHLRNQQEEKLLTQILKLKREISSIQKGEAPAPVKAKPKTAWEELLAGFKNRGQQKADKPKDKKGRQAEAVKVVKGMKSFQER